MLQLRSILTVADNSGAKKVSMIGMPGRGNKKIANVGEVINASVIEAIPFGQVKKGEKVSAVVVRTRKEHRRKDGSYIRFDDNACVLLQSKEVKDPKGTRIFGPIAKEVKDAGFNKIASLAEEVY
ncbi:50S ribosomal protein L14 [Candidatus Roizmanbacteria bacterium RIFOXYB2_FULL_38_10]|uniref:Large ribosomal subunit protein uL14 n=1 Tax=Candidatus Roizmanbacteria bacterium RIFOXYD1_FULL_38_12 TaxID=1802093 RepID=A0A1F7KZT8_9BACT|nr:MAG: 50S ribosomal protein L14 [Candidatus Roizmanbacteria bacterium RIFOXYA2_FULL_38_14]OGK63394.1 MAG: 50S ribosomal protein L14 [Candidatus Roizmanbacteria bacterium RIFOXYA1_FULL_37_12]OGK65240.1 MAG: 50S ribosomal protein L14 [Candidatus Roizmanbacteria bacterium RIFOXYB1_FULL_40_23]OGK68793.1 MAG: 50S ribosomal protein L14 [Candidatus Roizmanbacteria bacterium RIFOXYB2_FULL_38_10]OGK69645.1 MAG: 50S ribosomal protein L14 [Candidatus Roizmanbacteria bacterium RIFOXYC1_FULL_38_14]OGK727